MTDTADTGLSALSLIGAVLINGAMLAGMLFAGFAGASQPPEPPFEWVDVQVASLPALGEERDPKALPRIVEPPPPPPPETDVASLSREIEEEEIEKKKKEEEEKRKLADEKRRKEEEDKRLLEEEQKKAEREEKERKRRMSRALARVSDTRADEDSPEGFADGHEGGTSQANAAAQSAYVSLVQLTLSRQLNIPAAIAPEARKGLVALVHIRIDPTGKVQGEPSLRKSSGNKLFDQEALRAVRTFTVSGPNRIPPPPADPRALRDLVLRKGITARMRPN